MVLPNIHCTIVEVDEFAGCGMRAPRDLHPWADPYIARMVIKLHADTAMADLDDHEHDHLEPYTLQEFDPAADETPSPRFSWDYET